MSSKTLHEGISAETARLQHLVCSANLIRTPKLLQALPNAPFLVSEQWLRQSLKAATVLGKHLDLDLGIPS